MAYLLFSLEFHQPYRLKNYYFKNIGKSHDYFDKKLNEIILERIIQRSYTPLVEIIKKHLNSNENFKINLSFSGTFLEQLKDYNPDFLYKLIEICQSPNIEILAGLDEGEKIISNISDDIDNNVKVQIK